MATPIRTPNVAPSKTPVKPFNSNKSYPIRVAERLLGKGAEPHYSTARIDIDPEIKFSNNVASAHLIQDAIDSDTAELSILHHHDEHKVRYKGELSSNSDNSSYSLTFDHATQAFVLDRIDASISFSAERPASSGSDSAFSDGDGSVAGGASPDPNNPYDWRHQLHRRKDSSPEPGAFSDTGDASPAVANRARKASTPPGPVHGATLGVDMARAGSRSTVASTAAHSEAEMDFDADDDDDDGDDDDIQITHDDSMSKHGRIGRGRDRLPAPGGAGRQPRSLVSSVANSRSRSRQPMPHSGLRHHDDAGADDDDQDDHDNHSSNRDVYVDDGGDIEIELEKSPPPASDVEDQDVSDMEMLSPVDGRPELANTGDGGEGDDDDDDEEDTGGVEIIGEEQAREYASEQQQQQLEAEQVANNNNDDDEDNDSDGILEDFEAAFVEAEEEEGAAQAPAYQSDEDVSEEE